MVFHYSATRLAVYRSPRGRKADHWSKAAADPKDQQPVCWPAWNDKTGGLEHFQIFVFFFFNPSLFAYQFRWKVFLDFYTSRRKQHRRWLRFPLPSRSQTLLFLITQDDIPFVPIIRICILLFKKKDLPVNQCVNIPSFKITFRYKFDVNV